MSRIAAGVGCSSCGPTGIESWLGAHHDAAPPPVPPRLPGTSLCVSDEASAEMAMAAGVGLRRWCLRSLSWHRRGKAEWLACAAPGLGVSVALVDFYVATDGFLSLLWELCG